MKRPLFHALVSCTLLLCTPAAHAGEEPPAKILFYGNSFTQGGGGVQNLVRDIAVAAGHPEPHVFSGAVGGRDLAWHLALNTGIIESQIPEGDTWTDVVIQEYSTRPTSHPTDGDPAAFRANALSLFNQVRAHSPEVNATLFETWARGPGHTVYPGIWPDPESMQSELRTNYTLARSDINSVVAPDAARVAPVGDAFENGNWEGLYAGDIYHANNTGSLLAALVIYATVYDDTNITAIDLSDIADNLAGVSLDDANRMAQIAESTLVPAPSLPAAGFLFLSAFSMRRSRVRG